MRWPVLPRLVIRSRSETLENFPVAVLGSRRDDDLVAHPPACDPAVQEDPDVVGIQSWLYRFGFDEVEIRVEHCPFHLRIKTS